MPFAGRIAQSVEHSANNAAVQGSSPCMTNLLLFLCLWQIVLVSFNIVRAYLNSFLALKLLATSLVGLVPTMSWKRIKTK